MMTLAVDEVDLDCVPVTRTHTVLHMCQLPFPSSASSGQAQPFLVTAWGGRVTEAANPCPAQTPNHTSSCQPLRQWPPSPLPQGPLWWHSKQGTGGNVGLRAIRPPTTQFATFPWASDRHAQNALTMQPSSPTTHPLCVCACVQTCASSVTHFPMHPTLPNTSSFPTNVPFHLPSNATQASLQSLLQEGAPMTTCYPASLVTSFAWGGAPYTGWWTSSPLGRHPRSSWPTLLTASQEWAFWSLLLFLIFS